MKVLLLITLLAASNNATAGDRYMALKSKINALALANGFKVSPEVVDAIARASKAYDVDAMNLTAIGIIESGLGKYTTIQKNRNGTFDKGVFQINTVNWSKCPEFKLDTLEGNAFCAAKLLSQIKPTNHYDLAEYHSKTPSKKEAYFQKIAKVFQASNDK